MTCSSARRLVHELAACRHAKAEAERLWWCPVCGALRRKDGEAFVDEERAP